MFVVFLLGYLPAVARQIGRSSELVSALGAAVLGFWVLYHAALTNDFFRAKTVTVATGGDRILSDGRGLVLQDCADWIGAHTRPGASVVVLPEGAHQTLRAHLSGLAVQARQ